MSASGTPTSVTARQVTEAKIVNKVRNVPLTACLCLFPSYEPEDSQDMLLKIKWDKEHL